MKVLALMVIKLVLIFLQLSIIKINQFTLEYLIFINFCLTWVFITDIFKTTLSFMDAEGSEFIDQHHKHILSSNFKNIRDNKLTRDLNIEKTRVSFEKIKLDIIADLDESNEAWYTKHGLEKLIQ